MLGVHDKITRIYCRGKVNMLINIDQPWVFGLSNCVIVQKLAYNIGWCGAKSH